jgi:hypothetical protein
MRPPAAATYDVLRKHRTQPRTSRAIAECTDRHTRGSPVIGAHGFFIGAAAGGEGSGAKGSFHGERASDTSRRFGKLT